LLVALPLLGCTRASNDPDEYGPVTEANVLDGCIRSGMENPGDTRIAVVDDNEDDDASNDKVVFTQEVPADQKDPCECLYEGIVDQIDFAEFKDLDLDFEELVKAEEDGSGSGGGSTSTTSPTNVVIAIAQGCDFPSS
jgi:hypothetical protein